MTFTPRLELEYGFNRAYFTNSTIDFRGDGYAFTVHDARASDRPAIGKFADLFNTVAQYNFRLGARVHPHVFVNAGIDHMKYVLDLGQTAKMSGRIGEDTFDRADTRIGDGPIGNFEHTNGLNLVDVEVGYVREVVATPRKEIAVDVKLSGGVGMVIPKSDVTLFGERVDNVFHVAGYGLSAAAAVRATVFRYGFIEAKVKGGVIHLPDVLTVSGGKASHAFGYVQPSITLGVSVPLGRP